jgi:hypothetical protein
MLGPLIGSLLFSIGGYEFTFYTFGSMFFLFAVLVYKLFDAKLDKIL